MSLLRAPGQRHWFARHTLLCAVLMLVMAGSAGRALGRTDHKGIDALAASAPADTQIFMAFDFGDQTSLAPLAALKEALQKQPPLLQAIKFLEDSVGMTFEQFCQQAAPVGFFCCLPGLGERGLLPVGRNRWLPCEMALCLRIRDSDKVRDILSASLERPSSPWHKGWFHDNRCWVRNPGRNEVDCFVANGFMCYTTGLDTAERLYSSLRGHGASLYGQRQFREARKKSANADGWLGYVAIRDSLASLDALPGVEDTVDKVTMEGLRGLCYWVAGGDPRRQTPSSSFLVVDPRVHSRLAAALLQVPTADFEAARFVPQQWHNLTTVHLGYLIAVALEVARLPRPMRGQLEGLGATLDAKLGFDAVNQLNQATDGQMGVASNFFEVCFRIGSALVEVMPDFTAEPKGDSAPPSPPQIDPSVVVSNLRQLTVLFALHVKDAGRVPALVGQLCAKAGLVAKEVRRNGTHAISGCAEGGVPVRWTVTSEPQNALLVAVGQYADQWLDQALATAGGQQPSIAADVSTALGPRAERSVLVASSYADLHDLATDLISKLLQKAAKRRSAAAASLPALPPHSTYGSAAIYVERDGLRFTTCGTFGSLFSGAAVGMAAGIIIPTFSRLRMHPPQRLHAPDGKLYN